MQLADHSELFAVITELWTLIDKLAVVEPGALRLPPSDTGIHPATSFDADAALAAGFAQDAVLVMSALPYLHDSEPDMGQRTIEIVGSTFPLSYLHFDEDDFRYMREMSSDETIMPPSALRLTWQDSNGWEYIYDAEKQLVYVWNPINDDGDYFLHLQPLPPRQAFQSLLDDFRGLHRVALPRDRFVRTNEDSSPKRWPSKTETEYQASYNLWKATTELAGLYLECGWDANAVAQTSFRSSEFVDKRTKYVTEVLEPLDQELDKARQST